MTDNLIAWLRRRTSSAPLYDSIIGSSLAIDPLPYYPIQTFISKDFEALRSDWLTASGDVSKCASCLILLESGDVHLTKELTRDHGRREEDAAANTRTAHAD